jgi:hypothetical protein
MPKERHHVKWGVLVLRRDRSGKDDTQREETDQRRITGVGRGIKTQITSFPCKQEQPLSTRTRKGVCMFFEDGGGHMGPAGLFYPTPPFM